MSDNRCIGHGAFGVVFKAKIATSGITVAYKLIIHSDEDEFFKSFVNEIKIHRRVDDHPNIIRFLGISKDIEERYLMVFDYADNGSLRKYLSTPAIKLDWPANCQLGLDIVNGLRYIHKAGILHKDLSSNNVLIHGKTAKITDFGISEKVLLQKAGSNHLGAGAYLDPKCFNDNDSKLKRDEKSDVFSLGIILWEISSRKYPCSELDSISDIKLYRLSGGRHDVIPGTPDKYKNLYTECWDNESTKRPTSEECYQRLKNIMAELNASPTHGSSQNLKIEDLDHTLSNELSILYEKLTLKGKSAEQIADYFQNLLTQKQESLLAKLKAHTNCGQCFWLIGFFHAHGIEIDMDLGQAVQWYQLSAEAGNATAQNSLGICYRNGKGVEKSIQKAVELCQKAAEQGYAIAQFALGNRYSIGSGVEKNIQKAFELFQKAAAQGYANAQCYLGVCYENGTEVEKNIQKAVELYQKAAEQGFVNAQYALGTCYRNGTGVEKNIQKAVELYQKAAKQGHVIAQNHLSIYLLKQLRQS